ncbi:MAG: alkaline phosphatase family protein [bacterium]
MKKRSFILVCLIFFLIPCLTRANQAAKSPKLTVIIVADQFAYHYIEKLKNHFRFGIKEFLDYGICYQNAYHAHGNPETTPGHNSLSTGTLPKDHGLSGNSWINEDGEKIRYTNPTQTMVDGLSDQFIMKSTNDIKHHVFSFSLKQRSAMGTANKLGKALWLDMKNGGFVSSKEYFDQLPGWLQKFNKEHDTRKLNHVTWNSMYPHNSAAYNFPYIRNYDHSALDYSLIEKKKIPINETQSNNNGYADLYFKVPHSSQLIFNAAKACLDHHIQENQHDKLILWLLLSNLDFLCHYYGPDCFETIDLIYHLDKQIYDFMKYVRTKIDDQDIVWVFSADHGIQPIQEVVRKKGLKSARRIMAQPLLEEMNKLVKEKFNIENIVLSFDSAYFFLDHKKLGIQDEKTQGAIFSVLKKYLLKQEGIRHVWTKQELKKAHFEPWEKENFYKNQIYRNRIGDLICMPHPYCLITEYSTGCSHNTPYDYDTHVPLMLLRKGEKHKIINQKVWVTQLAATLARLLNISRPSASTCDFLPGIFD